MNTLEKLRAARERLAEVMRLATEGRWTVDDAGFTAGMHWGSEVITDGVSLDEDDTVCKVVVAADASLIAALHAAAPVLLGILDDALARVESLSFFTERADVGLARVEALADAILGEP